ncbi:hypothetical protein AC579_1847 [Pseudocercospora musae]|uniref:Uncharacterized protein n=1 Tax=Pseudocercospora musae TaxID=113226 RepID=A0A139I6T5_9PEZI|nr:hypothetical protein AC579_1847 [Pseudocercospora musae]
MSGIMHKANRHASPAPGISDPNFAEIPSEHPSRVEKRDRKIAKVIGENSNANSSIDLVPLESSQFFDKRPRKAAAHNVDLSEPTLPAPSAFSRRQPLVSQQNISTRVDLYQTYRLGYMRFTSYITNANTTTAEISFDTPASTFFTTTRTNLRIRVAASATNSLKQATRD